MNVRAVAGPGRGRKMTIQGRAMECARNVALLEKRWTDQEAVNGLYQMAYWGKAMRSHVAAMREAGEVMTTEAQRLVDRAEAVLNGRTI